MLHTSFFKQEKHLDYILHYLLIIESTSKAPYYKVKSKGFSNSKIGSICGLPLIFDKISEGQYHYIQWINKTLLFSLHAQRCFPMKCSLLRIAFVFSACAEIFFDIKPQWFALYSAYYFALIQCRSFWRLQIHLFYVSLYKALYKRCFMFISQL